MVGQARERNFNGPGIYLWVRGNGSPRNNATRRERERGGGRKKGRKNEKGSMTRARIVSLSVQWRTLERGRGKKKKRKKNTRREDVPLHAKDCGVASRVLQCWDEKRSAPGPFIFQPSNVFLRVSIASCHPSFFLSPTTLKVIAKNSSDRARDTEGIKRFDNLFEGLFWTEESLNLWIS